MLPNSNLLLTNLPYFLQIYFIFCRLQVETFDTSESRIHAAGCILQVFKLKGADRKHKQDRDKISRRPVAEQDKYAPSFDSTLLTDLSLEHIYVPATLSRPVSPSVEIVPIVPHQITPVPSSADIAAKTELSTGGDLEPLLPLNYIATPGGTSGGTPENSTLDKTLDFSASPGQVSHWLLGQRFSNFVQHFRHFDGQDMLRLTREETIALCGPSDGIRLYNSLHCTPVPPKTMVYVGPKDGENEYSALYLNQLTVSELLHQLAESFNLDLVLASKTFLIGPKGIFVKFTDHVVRHLKSETVFQFSLRRTRINQPPQELFDVIFEQVTASSSEKASASSLIASPAGHSTNSN